jgi:hypothetical protein
MHTETIELRFVDAPSVLVLAPVTEAGIVSYVAPMAQVGDNWLPLRASASPAVKHRWVLVPQWLEPLLDIS